MVSTHTPAHRQDGFLFGLAIGSYKRCHWLRKPLAALQLQHFRFKVSRRLLGFRKVYLSLCRFGWRTNNRTGLPVGFHRR